MEHIYYSNLYKQAIYSLKRLIVNILNLIEPKDDIASNSNTAAGSIIRSYINANRAFKPLTGPNLIVDIELLK